MKNNSKNNALTRAKKFIIIGGILGILTLMSFANLVTFPKNSPSTNLVNPNAASSEIPTLNSITPSTNSIGNITLSWNSVSGAQYYNVYVSTSPITEANIINNQYSNEFQYIFSTNYTDYEQNGVYYYVVTEVDSNWIESNCSNYESVTVSATAPSTSPTLSAISPNPNNSTQITISWSAVNNADAYNVYVSNSSITSGNIGNLISIGSVNAPQTSYTDNEYANGTYYYAVEAANGGGNSAPSNCQSVLEILYVPPAPILSSISPNPNQSGSITLSWSAVSGVQNYYVFESNTSITENNITNWQFNNLFSTTSTTYTDTEPDGTYYYAVTADITDGLGSNCSNCESVTVAATVPTAPILAAINPNPSTSSQINLSWNTVSNAINYSVYVSASSITSGNIGSLTPIVTVNAPQTSWTDTESTNGTFYYAIVANNEGGSSIPSDCQSVTLVIYLPATPILSAISPNPSTSGGVNLSWSAVSGALYYNVYANLSPVTESTVTSGMCEEFTDIFSTTFTDFEPNGTYYYAVSAVNSSGVSICSNCESANVSSTAPTTAPILAVISPNPSNTPQINLSWSAVSNAYGYFVFMSNSSITSANIGNLSPIKAVDAPQTSWTDTESTNGTFYYVIEAFNVGGNSTVSNCQSVTIAIPPVPMATYIGVSSGNSFQYNYTIQDSGTNETYILLSTVDNITDLGISALICFHFVMSNSTNSSIQTFYTNETVGAFDTTVPTSATPFINENISNKTLNYSSQSYPVEIQTATWDNNGVLLTSFDSFVGQITTLYRINSTLSPPNAPTNLNITPNPSKNGNVTLQWSASSGATSYKIYRYTSPITEINASVPLVTTTSNTVYNDVLTTNGTYYYVVIASNSTGDSGLSNCKSVTVAISVFPPNAPTNLIITPNPSTDGNITLQWNPSNGANSYKIYRYTSPITEINASVPLVTTTSNTVYNDIITTNGTYYYVVIASNSTGDSILSNCKSVTVAIPEFPPNAPTNLTITPNLSTNGKVNVQWSASKGATSYKIYRYTSPITEINASVPLVLTTSNTVYNDILTSNGTYYYVVIASNSTGDSGLSNCASVTVTISTNNSNTTPSSPPNAPTNLNVTPNPSKDGNVTLQWTASNGATSYKIYRYSSPITEINSSVTLVTTTSTTTYNDTLTTSGTYYYVVVASNSAGDSPISNCKSVVVAIQNPKSIPGFPLGIFLPISAIGVITIFLKKKFQFITA